MKRKVKLILAFLNLIILVGIFLYFKLSDLRPENYNYPNNIKKAKILLESMGKAHQIDKWNKVETYNVLLNDEFYGFLGKKAHPFREQEIELSLNYIPKSFHGQLEILTGKEKGLGWGIISGQTYQLDDNLIPKIKENKDVNFKILTYQYFIEFPSRIQEASVIDYIGTKIINGVKAEGVIASWNTVAPQRDIDQYIIWIDDNSKQIIKIDYTVRDKYAFISGTAHFQDYKNYEGIILPSTIPVESNLLKEGFVHKMRIKKFTPNKVPYQSIAPIR